MDAGLVGGIIGGVLGVMGGAIGTYFSITNTKGPKEKAFMKKASAVAWIAITLFLVLLILLPNPHRLWLWVPYGILLPIGIKKINSRVAEIRATEDVS